MLLRLRPYTCLQFLLTNPVHTVIYTLSLHDALPISDPERDGVQCDQATKPNSEICCLQEYFALGRMHLAVQAGDLFDARSEEHTSELQSRRDLVCRLLLEQKKNKPSGLAVPCDGCVG